MNLDEFEKAITSKTKAVIPVHLNGRLCNMERLMNIAKKHNLIVIEDAAQALGATYDKQMAGSFGDTGCFSFYPFKALGGYGDGGAVTTNDPEIARKVILLRFNGEDRETGEYHYHGYTALLDNIQAATLDVKLRHLPDWIDYRRSIADRYFNRLKAHSELMLPHYDDPKNRDGYQNYVIRIKRRDELRNYLKDNGVETLLHWPKPVWEHKELRLGKYDLKETIAICNESISLPMSAETTFEEVDITCEIINKFFGK